LVGFLFRLAEGKDSAISSLPPAFVTDEATINSVPLHQVHQVLLIGRFVLYLYHEDLIGVAEGL